MEIARQAQDGGVSVDVSSTAANCTVLDYRNWAHGSIQFASVSQTSVAIHACATEDGTFAALHDTSGNAISIDKADLSDGVYPIPAEASGCNFIKFIGDNAAADSGIVTVKG